jgi:hypothetical protein
MAWLFAIPFVLLALYALIGFFTARNALLRMRASWSRSPLDRGDVAFAVIVAGVLWPVGWPTSFIVLPSLRSYKRKAAGRQASTVNDWAERTLARKEIVP